LDSETTSYPETLQNGGDRDDLDDPLVIATPWVRERFLIPPLEQFLSAPPVAGREGDFNALRQEISGVVDLLSDREGVVCAEILQRNRTYVIGGLLSAVIGIVAIILALTAPILTIPGILVAAVEMYAVFAFRRIQRRLSFDFLAVSDLGGNYRESLNAAKTHGELRALQNRIRTELAAALGKTGAPPAEGNR